MMNLEREKRFHQLLVAALDREPGERRRFLAESCGDDGELLEEVCAAAFRGEADLGSFLDSPAVLTPDATRVERSNGQQRPAAPPTPHAPTPPPTSIAGRLRATPGVGLFGLLAAAMLILIGAAAYGTAAHMASADVELGFSSFSGRIRYLGERWSGARWDDELIAIGGARVDGDPVRIRAALLDLEPGTVTFRLRRDGAEWDAQVAATPRTPASQVLAWTRTVTGALLMVIGAIAFVLRPGHRVTWIFLFFCASLGLHLLGYVALLRHPPRGLSLETVGFYLTAATGLHLFIAFPHSLSQRRLWALGFYLPALAAIAILVPLHRDPAAYPVLSRVAQVGAYYAAAAAVAAIGLVLLQYLRARRARDAVARARSRALLVGVVFGLALPAVMGALRVVELELAAAFNSFLVVIFVVVTGYTVVRHNAFEVDRFTAAILGYGATTAVLAVGFGALVVGVPALAGTSGLFDSPLVAAGITAAFFVAFQPLYRRVKKRVDRWYLRERVEEDTALRLLRQLANSVRTSDLSAAFRAGLDTAMALHAERAELWSRTPEGSFARLYGTAGDASPAGARVAGDSPLIEELKVGSGGLEGLADRALDAGAQRELWTRELALAAPVYAGERLHGFVALGRKASGAAYTRRERAFLDTVASHLGIAMERGWSQAERLGPYRVLGRLGTGGMAEVYLAEKHGPGGFELQVAMKRILPHLARDSTCVAMFLDEARIAAQLRHPHIVPIYDIEEHDETYFLTMEYVDGPTLGALIKAASRHGTTLPLPVAAAVAAAVLAALGYAHRKKDRRGQPLRLVHRDVKPGNVLLTRQGEIKLADFGVARAEFRLHQTQPGLAKGTVPYMPPEQQLGGDVGPAADLFAAGAVIYEMITGRRAFPDGAGRGAPVPPTRFDPGLPPPLDDFMGRAVAERPSDRFASAEAMRAAFLEAIAPAVPAGAEEVAAYVASLAPPEAAPAVPKHWNELSRPSWGPVTASGLVAPGGVDVNPASRCPAR